jgi:hypothetical protein
VVDAGAADDGQPVDHDFDLDRRDRRLERVVSVDFASTALIRFSVAAQVLAAAGVLVWGVVTFLQWHQIHTQGGSGTEQALGALEPFSILLFAAILGMIGFGCRLAGDWIGLRVTSDYLSETPEEGHIDSPLRAGSRVAGTF